ncbi:MAG: cobalt-precorrin-5B (C(1))-methyltransferase, partial [Actinomycetota bacterium]|nr:cobalt-precorrin-5B (C(1))-methyltransferase [Actinomycetota bacterium]
MTGETTEPELSPEVAARRRGLRLGWTTGTCASAAAKAAVVALATGRLPAHVDVGLPGRTRVTFPVLPTPPGPEDQDAPASRGGAGAVVVKDAGDDPDCTDGAHVTATVSWAPDGSETVIEAGTGV